MFWVLLKGGGFVCWVLEFLVFDMAAFGERTTFLNVYFFFQKNIGIRYRLFF